MTNPETHSPHSGAVKIAGVAYLVTVLGGILYWVAIGSKITVSGAPGATALKVLEHEQLFRLGIAYDILMSMNLLAFALAHYSLLKPTGRALASVGRWLVLVDAFLVAGMGLQGFIALHLLAARSTLVRVGPQQLADLVGLYLNVQIAGQTFGAVFMHLGGLAFYALFLKSKLIPRALAVFGIAAYGLVLTAALINVLVPGAPANMLTMQDAFNTVCVVPSILLEVIAGGWLLTKGVAVRAVHAGGLVAPGLIEAKKAEQSP